MATCKKCGKRGLLLKLNFEDHCEECQKIELERMRSLLSPEQKTAISLQEKISSLAKQLNEMHQNQNALILKNQELDAEIKNKKEQIFSFDDQIIFQDFCLYTPRFKYKTSEEYKKRIDDLREKQKSIIRNGMATNSAQAFSYNGSEAQGKKFLNDMSKLFLRAFNCECDDAIDHVKYNNYDLSVRRIKTSAETIQKLGKMMQLSISGLYLNSKLEELDLVYEYQQIKQREKEEQKALREQLREEQKLLKEIEEERKKVEKEKKHYINALSILEQQLSKDPQNEDLLSKKSELETAIEDANKAMEDIDYRVANKRAGYVYVISNIGSFGEGVYKIGMTRRLKPEERIDELSDASVPFNFDVHAMIFTDDAPALESALHRAFADKRVNMINNRREFFKVSLEEIKKVILENYDKTVEFQDIPDAEQYHMSLKMKNEQ